MQQLKVSVAIVPRIIFDLRDWYQSTFATAAEGGLVRAAGTTVLLADPTNPRDINWPFTETVELVTQPAGANVRSFHGRVRTRGGVLLNRNFRQLRAATKCRLTIQVQGLQPHAIDDLPIPGIHDSLVLLPPINLFPAVDYPFLPGTRPQALLVGAIKRADGNGLEGATITPLDTRVAPVDVPLPAVQTGSDGRYLLVLDGLLEPDGTTSFAGIDFRINHPAWAAPVDHSFPFTDVGGGKFRPPTRGSVASTTFFGRVLRDARPVSGAVLSLQSAAEPLLVGSVRTDSRGLWTMCGDARLPLTGARPATLTCSANGQAQAIPIAVRLGAVNEIPPITLPLL